jgi:hypothetical protein
MPWRAPWPERWSIKISLCDGDCRDATSLTCFLASFRAFFCSLVSPSMSPSPSTSIVTSPAGASDFLMGKRANVVISTYSQNGYHVRAAPHLFFFLSFLSAAFSSLTSLTISMAASCGCVLINCSSAASL